MQIDPHYRITSISSFLKFCIDILDNASRILANIVRLKSDLANIVEPDFGLLDHLLSLDVLTPRQLAAVRSERTAYERNDAVLDLMNTENQCAEFVKALQRTGQQHVANFVTQNGGQYSIAIWQV